MGVLMLEEDGVSVGIGVFDVEKTGGVEYQYLYVPGTEYWAMYLVVHTLRGVFDEREGRYAGTWYSYVTCVAPPTKKMSFRRFFAQIYDWKHLYRCIFSFTAFCRSVTTSATLLIPKCTTWRWTLRCSNYSVAKRCLLYTSPSPRD